MRGLCDVCVLCMHQNELIRSQEGGNAQEYVFLGLMLPSSFPFSFFSSSFPTRHGWHQNHDKKKLLVPTYSRQASESHSNVRD